MLTVTSTQDSGHGSLRAEIAASHSGDTIVFSPTLDGKTITLTSGELDLTKDLTIHGPGADDLTISGNDPVWYAGEYTRVFEVARKHHGNAERPDDQSWLRLCVGFVSWGPRGRLRRRHP